MTDSTSSTVDEAARLAARTDRRIEQMHLKTAIEKLERQSTSVDSVKALLAKQQAELDRQLAELVERGLTPTDLSRRITPSHTSITKAVARHRDRSTNHEGATTHDD